MSKVWGPELLAANKAKQDKQALQKVYDRWVSKKVQGEDQAAAVWGQLNRMAVDDDIMEANLGRYMREVSDGSGGGAQPTPALPKPVANPGGLDPTGGDVPGMSGLLG
jgi:hypothetical protein